MTLVEVVILLGSQCLSPLESGGGLTEATKVPCAVLIRHDPQTAEVEIVPPSAATDPALIAMLVKPREGAPAGKVDRLVLADHDDITGSITRAPVVIPASAAVEPAASVVPKPKPVMKKKRDAKPAAKRKVARSDACGSYRAVWYTNKDGRRKYRCVKAG